MPNSLLDETPLAISEEMPELAIAEMCCDWYARSMQYNTNVWEFYHIRTKNRWKFSEQQIIWIEKYLELLTLND